MSVLNVQARIQCDGCGTNFIVNLDPEKMRPKGWSLADEAVDSVRGGDYEVPRGGCHVGGQCSVQGDLLLCASCTKTVDEHTPESPTPEQVRDALDKHVIGVAESA